MRASPAMRRNRRPSAARAARSCPRVSIRLLSCADSRVPPEHVFNVGLGDLFVIRTAGEVTDHPSIVCLDV